jgi:hypothetical protein
MFYGGIHAGRKGAIALAACALAGLAAVAGCSSGGGQPSWAGALGSGVTVDSPSSAGAGNGSPEGVMIGVVTAVSTGQLSDFCKYEAPAKQSQCTSSISGVTAAEAKTALPTFKNIKLGYTAIDGTKALIGITGTVCEPKQTPSCFTNNDPAAILDSGKSFSTLWSEALSAPQNVYSLSTAEEINGSWYAYTSN